MYERSSLRYAHTNGFTSLIYTNDGEFILTCGSDGDIRKWRGIDDDDPSSNCLGEYIICLAEMENKLLAATDRNTVQAYNFPNMDLDGTLMRFTAPVTTIKVRHNWVAAGSDDTKIKVIKGEVEPIELEGHAGPVLALDMHPNLLYLASVGGEGVLKIWNINEEVVVKTITGLPKFNSFENAKCFSSVCFQPSNGTSFAYVIGKEILILNTNTWEKQCVLKDDKINGIYTCCEFSKDGFFLAVGTDLGEISVFDVSRRQAIKCEPPSSECQSITCLAWNSKNNNEIAYCDASGQLGILFSTGEDVDKDAEEKNSNAVENIFGEIEFAEDNSQSINKLEEDNVEDEDSDIEKLKSKIISYANVDLVCDEETRNSIEKVRSESPTISEAVFSKTIKQQAAFQPSSTPLQLEHRYLVWNTVGIVTLHADGSEGALDVEFHDASVHHSLHIPNYNGYNIASLSSSVLAMSSVDSSKVVCIALSSSGNREWSLQLPDCESVDALCATSKMVVVASNMQFLRIFSVMGTQKEVISIPGPVVCMSGYEDRVLVCYHSAPYGSQQNILGMLLRHTGFKTKCQNVSIPIKPERQLAWVGFSDCGSPVLFDSMGLVQLFNLNSNCWYPVCDTVKQSSSISNNYFVISLSERSQILQAVLCRGTSYPMTTPRPMVQELPLQLPLCDMESEKSIFEDSLLRGTIMAMDNAEKNVKETAIKLFALACRSEIEVRAKELIETMASTDLLMLAVKYATKLGRIHLSDKLSEMLPQIEEEQQARESDEQPAEQSLPASSLYTAKENSNYLALSSKKIAPKIMDLGTSKKTFKRFSYGNGSPSISLFKKSSEHLISTPSSETSQENFSDADIALRSQKVCSREDETSVSRSPLNSVNPFASKRKLSDVDKAILMGSEKLKISKK